MSNSRNTHVQRVALKAMGAVAPFAVVVGLVAGAENTAYAAGSVLILENSVTGGTSSLEAQLAGSGSVSAGSAGTLTGLGYTVNVVTDAQWAAMTTAQFASYTAIVLGDPTCVVGTSPIAAAMANTSVWGPAVTGNVIAIGTDPVFHYQATNVNIAQVTYNAIKFAAAGGGTGIYVGLSCYYNDSTGGDAVPVLSPFGSFTVRGSPTFNPSCFMKSHIESTSSALNGLTDGILSNWGCSVHEAFDTYPATFTALAIADTVTGEGSLTFADGHVGVPYIVARGAIPVDCGDGVVAGTEQCDDGSLNGTCGDKCSKICTEHWCGDGVVDPGEQCDLGCSNGAAGSACSSTCNTVAVGAPPSCALTAVIAGPPKQLQITVQDSTAGIQSVQVTESNNATTVVPTFSTGDTSPLVVTATKIDQTQGAQVALSITGVDGQVTTCDPVIPGEVTQGTATNATGTNEEGGCNVGGSSDGPLGTSAFLAGLVGLSLLNRRRGQKRA